MTSAQPIGASANRVTSIVIGALFVLLGALGFTVTIDLPITSPVGALLLETVSLNSLQNVIHLAIGGVLVAAALVGRTQARLVTRVLGTLLLGIGLAGLFLSSTDYNALAVNAAANLVHFLAAATLLAVGLGTDREPAPAA